MASALVVAGAAMAQDAPFTVTKVWEYNYETAGNPVRDGAGVNGKVYLFDKAAGKVLAVDAAGATELAIDAAGCNAITADDAGNIILKVGGFGSAADAQNSYRIFHGAEGDATAVEFAAIEGYAGRADLLGRAIGDVWSEEGAAFFTTANATGLVRPIVIQNGEANTDLTEYTNDVVIPSAANTMSTAVPSKTTMAELLEIDPLYEGGFYFRSTSSAKNIYGWNADNGDYSVAFNVDVKTEHGWDVFEMNGKKYPVMADNTANWNGGFVIADETGAVIYTHTYDGAKEINPANGNGSVLEARVVDANTVQIYQAWIVGAANVYCAMFEVKFPAAAAEGPAFLLRGSMNDWGTNLAFVNEGVNPGNADELVYTLTLADAVAAGTTFKIACEDWTAESLTAKDGVIALNGTVEMVNGYGAGNTTINEALKAGAKFTLYYNTTGASSWLKVDGEVDEEVVVPVTAPKLYYRGTLKGVDLWNEGYIEMAVAADKTENNEYVYTVEFAEGVDATDEFKIASESWNPQFTAKGRKAVFGETVEMENGDGMGNNTSFSAGSEGAPVKLTFYYNPEAGVKGWLTAGIWNGVNDIAAEAAADAVYYNLQGVKVANPAAGNLYIKVAGNKATKVLVK